MRRLTCWRNGLLLATLVVTAGGCVQSPGTTGGLNIFAKPGRQCIGVERLAQDLDLRVVDQTKCHATLKNSVNIVMIYPDPGGRVYVNGRQVGRAGGILCDDGEVVLPVALEQDIRLALRREPIRQETVIAPTRPPVRPSGGHVTGQVVIDAGHGGKDSGAISVLGFYEKHVVLDVATKLAGDLQAAGAGATLTRSGDTFIDLDDRNNGANAMRADLFMSIHADSAPRSSARGFTIYIARSAGSQSLAAAEAIERGMTRAGFHSLGIRRRGLRVLDRAQTPALLLELGYVTNPTEAAMLNDGGYRTAYAQAICEGVAEYLEKTR